MITRTKNKLETIKTIFLLTAPACLALAYAIFTGADDWQAFVSGFIFVYTISFTGMVLIGGALTAWEN